MAMSATWLLVLLPLACASPSSPDVTIVGGGHPKYDASGESWHYEIGYTTVAGVHCMSGLGRQEDMKNSLPAAYLQHTSNMLASGKMVQDYQCWNKCAASSPSKWGGSNECAGYCSAPGTMANTLSSADQLRLCAVADDKNSRALCGDVTECKALCDATPSCYGFDMVSSAGRCTLLHETCQEKLLTGGLSSSLGDLTDYVAKMDPERRGRAPGCVGGIWVDGDDMKFKALNVRYDVEKKHNEFAWNSSDPMSARVKWHASGCGWVVEMQKSLAVAAPALTCPASACEDQTAATNWIFGQTQASGKYDPVICHTTRWWLESGYCQNVLWRALCPQTCAVPCSECTEWGRTDSQAQAGLVADMMDITVEGQSDCSVMKGLNMCTDPVVQLVCAGTCRARRMTMEGEEDTEDAHPSHSRLREVARRRLSVSLRASLEATDSSVHGRQLGIDGAFEEVYGTYDPTDTDGMESKAHRCRDQEMPTLLAPKKCSLYDWHAFNRRIPGADGWPMTLARVCPLEPHYETVEGVFCNENNIILRNHVDEEIKEHQCYAKCLAGDLGDYRKSGPDFRYCDGNDASFNQFSNALCLPREECERLCDRTEDCFGIEMHKTKPRCYLNRHACTLAHTKRTKSSQYNLLVKKAKRQDFATHFLRSCSYTASTDFTSAEQSDALCSNRCATSNDKSECESLAGSTAPPLALCAWRDECEELCAADADCKGFNIDTKMAVCMLVRGAVPCPATSLAPYSMSSPHHFVEKTGSQQCMARVSNAPHEHKQYSGDWQAQPDGSYQRTVEGEMLRLTWEDADTVRGGRCAAWHMGPSGAPLFRTANNVTDVSDCPTVAPEMEDRLDSGSVYWVRPPQQEDACLSLVCDKYSACPLFATCVLASQRFEAELRLQYRSANIDAVRSDKMTPLSARTASERMEVLKEGAFKPKVIASVERTTAFISRKKWESGAALFRNIPGSLRWNLLAPSKSASWDKLVLTLASSHPAAVTEYGSESVQELGRSYPLPAGHEPWWSDVLRVEMFDHSGSPVNTPIRIEIYAPVKPRLECFRFDPTAASSAMHTHKSGDGGFQVEESSTSEGHWTITTSMNGDYVCTSELPCAGPPPHVCEDPSSSNCKSINTLEELADCTGMRAGGTCELQCARARAKVGDYHCSMGEWVRPAAVASADGSNDCEANPYVAERSFWRLTHRSRMDYGWKVFSVKAFSTVDCTGTPIALEGLASSGEYRDKSRTYTAVSVLDESTKAYWWSKCLNCNPFTVDDTHGARASLDFYTAPTADVVCVQVRSVDELAGGERMYFPTLLELSRGWQDDTGSFQSSADQPSVIHVDGWTDTFVMGPHTADKPFWNPISNIQGLSLVEAQIPVTCGQRDSLVLGELLPAPHDVAKNVPSACHCQQLCIDNIDKGCVSWKYRYACPAGVHSGYCSGSQCTGAYVAGCEAKVCFLQRTIVEKPAKKEWGSSNCNGDMTGFVSGTTGLRITGVEPSVVKAAEDFELTVKGVNMPFSKQVQTRFRHTQQRIKLVEKGESCGEAEGTPQLKGVGCISPTVCFPGPAKADASSATWSKMRVASGKEDKEFTVCYSPVVSPNRWDWYEVPGTVKVRQDMLSWKTTPEEVKRKTAAMNMTINRGAFSSFSDPKDWRIKIVRVMFDCKVFSDPKLVLPCGTNQTSCGAGAADLEPSKVAVDSAEWHDIGVYTSEAVAGRYHVCFTDNSTEGEWRSLPSEDGELMFEIDSEDGDTSFPRSVFSYQTMSAKVGHENNVTLEGYRLLIPSGGRLALMQTDLSSSIVGSGACGTTDCNSNNTNYSNSSNCTMHDSVAGKSSYTGLFMQVDLPDDFNHGKYDMCFCDANKDKNLSGTGHTYQWTEDRKVKGAQMRLPKDALVGSAKDWGIHECYTKCSRGCTGMDCFCDGFDVEKMTSAADSTDNAAALCLSALKCKDACEDMDSCTGFDSHVAMNRCYLTNSTNSSNLDKDEDYIHWDKKDGTACQEASDFSSRVGQLWVTRRPSVDNSWVLEPDTAGSLEVTGQNMSWYKDRVMVINGGGRCGVSETTEALVLPTPGPESSPQHMWNHWAAVPDYDFWMDGFDPPFDNSKPTYIPPPTAKGKQDYMRKEKAYCPGSNLPAVDSPHQCFKKCSSSVPCEEWDCFCDGYYNGYDGPSSSALCLNMTMCEQECAATDDCYGVDMHRTKARCFLNMKTPCEDYVQHDGLAPDESYDFLYKMPTVQRRLEDDASTMSVEERRLLPAVDEGYSWDQILRYKQLRFRAGGNFKVCFCDHELLPSNRSVCTSAEDYNIEVGQLSVSGVFCLVKERRYQRGICVEQRYGGLRCYGGPPSPPVLTIPRPSAAARARVRIVAPVQAPAISSWCQFGPEEEIRDHPQCIQQRRLAKQLAEAAL